MIPTSAQHLLRTRRRRAPGFTVAELIILIAILGVLLTVVVLSVGNQPVAIKNVKLQADVTNLNGLVNAYIADGGERARGNLAQLSNPQAVLDRLKRGRPQSEWQRHTGATSGKLVDVRLRARLTTSAPTDGLERAKWNQQLQRFEITKGGGTAAVEFYLDETLTKKDYGTDTRTEPVVKYNTGSRGWVWASSTTPKLTYPTPGTSTGTGVDRPFNPNEAVPVPPTPPVDPGDSGGDDGGGGDTGGGGSTAPAATKLPTPTISPGGGTFAYAAFPTLITINRNNAPAGDSQLQYRINSGGWTNASGAVSATVTVASGQRIEVRNATLDTALYKDSNTASGTYYRLAAGFTGNHTGTWGNATGGANLVTSVDNGTNSSTVKHGNTKLDLGGGQYLDAGVENVLTFNKAPFTDITPNTWFSLGSLVMLNGTTFYNSEADGTTLSINFNLSEPAQTGVVHVNFGLISTDNTSDRLASADIVELRNPNTGFTVTIDGVQYRLELSFVTLDPGAGVVQGNQFLIFEGASAQAELRARFVSNH